MAGLEQRYVPVDDHVRRFGIDEARTLAFCTPYGCSKGVADQYVLDYARTYGIPTAVLRMSCIYGPRQLGTEDQGWVAHFLRPVQADEPITVFGDGKQVRDILHVEDAVARQAGRPAVSRFGDHPPLRWPDRWIHRHQHHHHRFDNARRGLGAEVEASRGCPYSCSFFAKIDFRDSYRRRDLDHLLAEIYRLIDQGVGYIYFIDEIFLPQAPLLEALAARGVSFGVQTRIDLWKPEMLALLGRAFPGGAGRCV